MKQSKLFLMAVLMVSAFVFQPNAASAVVAPASPAGIAAPAATAPELSKKQTRKIERLEKRLERMVAKSKVMEDISIHDSERTWLIRWLVLWAIGAILFPVLPGIWYLGGLVITLGTICGIIWFLKFIDAID